MSDPMVIGTKYMDVDAQATFLEDRAAVEFQFSGSQARFDTQVDRFFATEMPSLLVGVTTSQETYVMLGSKSDFGLGSKKGHDFGVSFSSARGFSKTPDSISFTKETKAGVEVALMSEAGDAKIKLSAGYLNRDGQNGVYFGFGGRF